MNSEQQNKNNVGRNLPFEELGEAFADAATPAHFFMAVLRYRNGRAAKTVGLDQLDGDSWVNHFARFAPLPKNMQTPLAIRYHGHQFGQYNPQIGDGRGFLFAQLRDDRGRLLDLGTKGSGQTPYSRSGDGRLTLKGGVREVLATEMLEACNVYASKTLSLIETGEDLHRNDEPSPARSSVLVRLSHSHIRFGAFQRLAYLDEPDNLAKLIEHSRKYYHPDIPEGDASETAPALLAVIAIATARMVASWMANGFVHGVMNTDNMNVTGETFDFGPYRFLPHSDPGFTAAYFDEQGRYSFGRQPSAALWNLQQLGGAFTLVADNDELSKAIGQFETAYREALRDKTFFKLGLETGTLDEDLALLQQLFSWMTATRVPWEQLFFDWFCGTASEQRASESPVAHLYADDAFTPIRESLMSRPAVADVRLLHPYFSQRSPETLLIDEIEHLWASIAEDDDWSLFHAKLDSIAQRRKALLAEPDEV